MSNKGPRIVILGLFVLKAVYFSFAFKIIRLPVTLLQVTSVISLKPFVAWSIQLISFSAVSYL